VLTAVFSGPRITRRQNADSRISVETLPESRVSPCSLNGWNSSQIKAEALIGRYLCDRKVLLRQTYVIGYPTVAHRSKFTEVCLLHSLVSRSILKRLLARKVMLYVTYEINRLALLQSITNTRLIPACLLQHSLHPKV